MIKETRKLEILLTHSTRLSSPKGRVPSTGFLPVISSKSTTPNENTSDFSVNLPLDAYSGAKYLKEGMHIKSMNTMHQMVLGFFLITFYLNYSFL